VRRLFPDYRSVEEDYLRRTGLFPIMHTVVIQRSIYEAHPEAALALMTAFEEARSRGRARLRDLDTLAVMHPWIVAELEELKEQFSLFGGDPFAYGIARNRDVLEALADYSHEQGLSSRLVGIEELFAPETHDWVAAPVTDEAPA
jgi:4,5-dihydroxyphthalate decarboxylase